MRRRSGQTASAVLVRILLLLLLASAPINAYAKVSKGTEIIGNREPCNNEGEIVPVNSNLDTMKCFRCICKNGFVECQKDCPAIDGCHRLVPKKPEECCSQCRGCMYRGVWHDSGAEWTEPGQPCRMLTCEAGIVTEADLQCYTPCRNALPPTTGKCCATCPGCRINGQNVTKERDVTIPEDPCVKCLCEGSRMTCVKKACPVLQCAVQHQKRVAGECCPRCTGIRRLMHVRYSCMVGDTFLKDEQRWDKDWCTHCRCSNETAVCKRNTCPVLECDPDLQKTKPGDCCPQCPPVEEVKTDCTVGGRTYQDGESWQLDPCKSCMCHQGEPRCAMQRCQPRGPCPPGFKSVKRPGQCCSECVENDGVCTVFGDPHYKTFDGKFFSFQGSCKYQLAADCSNQSFSIRVTNDARNTRHYAWTRTVSLKAGDLRINLGQKLRVKVNGKRINPPFTSEGLVKIERRNESVSVMTHVGVGLLWDGGGLLAVSVSAMYKGRLCGLCGNYNSVAQDDLTTRRGKALTDHDVWKFGNSWRVGGKRACGRQNEHPYKKPQCKPKSGKNPCRHLKDTGQFNGCDSKLNPHNYYEACLQDMCECPTGTCYCESLSAYAHECTRLGVDLPDWRRDTRCRHGRNSNKKSGERHAPSKSDSNRNRDLGYDIKHLLKPASLRNPIRLSPPPIK